MQYEVGYRVLLLSMWQKTALLISILICSVIVTKGQIGISNLIGSQLNSIPTSVPFLTIGPDARSAGMGDVGAASLPDVYSQHWNSAKYAFIEGRGGVSLTYTPWITNLIPDIAHLYLAGYYKPNDKNTISGSLRYFSLGTTTFFNAPGGTIVGVFHPKEIAVDAGYSRKFTDHFSGGIVLRYIHSDLVESQIGPGGQEMKPGTSLAGDFGLYYQDDILVREKNAQWALGLNLSNIGSPISYTRDAEKMPIPTNLRIGGRFLYHINETHSISLNADAIKLLVPTPPVYDIDTATGNLLVLYGREAPQSLLAGMFQSLYDAPGVLQENGSRSVFLEEMHEIIYCLGTEYWFRKKLAIRTGYFHEHATKGNRKYFTFGLGARFRLLTFDVSYLLPVQGQNSPLAHTFRISLGHEL